MWNVEEEEGEEEGEEGEEVMRRRVREKGKGMEGNVKVAIGREGIMVFQR